MPIAKKSNYIPSLYATKSKAELKVAKKKTFFKYQIIQLDTKQADIGEYLMRPRGLRGHLDKILDTQNIWVMSFFFDTSNHISGISTGAGLPNGFFIDEAFASAVEWVKDTLLQGYLPI